MYTARPPILHAPRRQQGFTLIELMISLVLGLLISAAVIQVYMANVRSVTLQEAASSLIDANVFGLPVLENHVRLASLGLAETINDTTSGAGIVLTADDNLKDIKLAGNSDIPSTLLTNTGDVTDIGVGNAWTAVTAMDRPSGQLTIQFRAPQDMYDCEGSLALGPREVTIGGVKQRIDGQVIIERYYLNAQNSTPPTVLSLYCDAGRYITEEMDDYTEQGRADKASTVLSAHNRIKGFGGKGAMLVKHMEYFDVLLGTKSAGNVRYYTTRDYLAAANKPDVISIKIGAILRSDNVVQAPSVANTFAVLGHDITLTSDADADQKYMRTVVNNEIALRNARPPVF